MSQSKKLLLNNWTKKYNIKEVYIGTILQKKTISYLKNQNYIEYEGINNILQLNYNKKFPIGYVIKLKNKVVGFVGTLFSKRKINNKNYLYCNIHTWVVDKIHRVASHLLFKALLRKSCIVTVLSPQNRLIDIFKKMGFQTIQMSYKIIFFNIFKILFYKKSYLIEKKPAKIQTSLSKKDLKIYKDHNHKTFIKFNIANINNKSSYCLVIAKIIKKKKYFKVLNILYVSNLSFFQKNWDSINVELFKTYKVFFYGHYFIRKTDCIFLSKLSLSINFKKAICVKNLPKKFIFNTLYSEAI